MDQQQFTQEHMGNAEILHEIVVTARNLYSDDAIEGFHVRAGQTHSSDDGVVLNTEAGGSQITLLWNAHFAILPHNPDGARAVIYVRGTGSIFDDTIDSYIELNTNMGRVVPDHRGIQLDDGRFVFIVDDLSASDHPNLTISTINNGQNYGQSWDIEEIKVEFHRMNV